MSSEAKGPVSSPSFLEDTLDCDSCDTWEKADASPETHMQVNLEAEARTPILGQMERDRNCKEEKRLIVTFPE